MNSTDDDRRRGGQERQKRKHEKWFHHERERQWPGRLIFQVKGNEYLNNAGQVNLEQ
jgi:hypothetical protein